MNNFTKARPDVYHNAKAKIYADGTQKITVCTDAIFKDAGWEARDPPSERVSKPKKMDGKVRDDNVRRAKSKVFDIAQENDFQYFITWTLDKEKIDRYDPAEVSKKLKQFLNDRQKRNGLKYLIIPEHHKDGAIHMHGLISADEKFTAKFQDSGKKTKDGKQIYNMPQWSLGYSTAIEITGEKEHISKYITKYISKDFKKIFGSFYYAGGKGLHRSPSIKLYDIDYNSVNSTAYIKSQLKLGFKYITVSTEGEVLC